MQHRDQILNVEDYPSARYIRTRILQEAGFDVREAANGKQALETLSSDIPELVLLDMNLPDMTGVEVCRRIKSDPATAATPVLHLSATCREADDRIVALEAGAAGYLLEPIEPAVLVATIRAVIRERRQVDDRSERVRTFAHRFNNLLTGILGHVSIAYEEVQPESAAGLALSQVMRAGEDAVQLAREFLSGAATARPSPAPASQTGTVQGRGQVLIVDDEEIVRTIAQAALERRGYSVLLARNGREALEIFRARAAEIAAVVLDLTMPGMGGEQVVPRLREIRPDVPIIASSGYDPETVRQQFGGQQLAGFLHKPYTSAELAEAIRRALES